MWPLLVVFAIALGRYASPTFPGVPVGTRPVARLPPPPADLPTLLYQLGVGSVTWYVAVVSVPLLVRLARRIDARRLGPVSAASLVAVGTFALIVVTSSIDYAWTFRDGASGPPIGAWAAISLRQHVLPWLAIVGAIAAIEARRRAVRADVERERLRAEVAEQRLIALAGQLRPHFLFNALQAISTLIHRDPQAADAVLTKLSDLLRDVLRHRDSAFVRLDDELRYAGTWLDIAKVRFADRLTFDIDVPGDLHGLSVPLFILQPLVENALGHGIGGVLAGGHITIRAGRAADRLWLEVIDDGAGLGGRSQPREGVGLANTRERLEAAFGADQQLTLTSRSPRGTVARIELPARAASQAVRS